MYISRREFLKLCAAAGLSTTILGRPRLLVEARKEEVGVKYYYTSCGVCGAHCGVIAKVKNGILIEVYGNPNDQHSRGKLCGKGLTAVQQIYNPDRITHPLIRTNPEKGIGIDPKFRRIDWDEAIDLVVEKMYDAIRRYGPKSIVAIGHHKFNDLLKAIGSPNYFCHHTTCNASPFVVQKYMFGSAGLVYDLENAKYILCFGWNQVGNAKNPLAQAFMNGVKKGAKVVVFDPVFTVAASKADEYYPINPGTDLAVVLAMINTIVNESLYDKDFVDKYCYGFDRVTKEVSKYTPEWAERISGVPANVIRRIAREFATIKPACAPMWKRGGAGPLRLINYKLAQALLILQAITGNVEVKGGLFKPRKNLVKIKPKEAPPKPDGEPLDGSNQFPIWDLYNGACRGLYQALPTALSKADYVKVVFFTHQNILSIPGYRKMIEALKDKFVVVFTTLPDETCYLADVVFPDIVGGYEGNGLTERVFSRFAQVSIIQKVVDPPVKYSLGKVKIEIAKRLGNKLGVDLISRLPIGKPDDMLKKYGITFEELKKYGVYPHYGEFKPNLKFKTPTGKIELTPTIYEKYGYDSFPHWEDTFTSFYVSRLKDDEFFLTTMRTSLRRNYKMNNIPWIVDEDPINPVWINPRRAHKLGIRDGDEVIVEVVRDVFGKKYSGELKVTGFAKLTERVSPNVAVIPYGYGKWSKFLTIADKRGIILNELVPPRSTDEYLKLRIPIPISGDVDLVVRVVKM